MATVDCHKGSKMDGPDVIIFYSHDTAEWNSYLMRCFQDLRTTSANNRPPLNVRQICLGNMVLPLPMSMIDFYRRAKVQIVIVSPDFLDIVLRPGGNECLGNLFEPSRVLALMCGVVENEVTAEHRARLASFDAWKTMTVVENDSEFVVNLIAAALEVSQVPHETVALNSSKAFRLFPSKAREGNSLVLVELKNPLPENQVASVSFETENDQTFPIDVKCANPYILKFVVPDCFFGHSQYVHVHVRCGSESLGVRSLKCESKMGELRQLLESVLDPVEFMCQSLGLASAQVEHIDRVLVKSLRENFPKTGFSLFDFDKDICRRRSASKVPTLLHFAAKSGLQEVCTALLDCPGATAACRIRNSQGLGPIELAETEGHSSLANMIDNFMKLSETEQMYRYMKSVAEGESNVDYENLRTTFAQNVENMGYFASPFADNDVVGTDGLLSSIQDEHRPLSSEVQHTSEIIPSEDPVKPKTAAAAAAFMPFSQSQQELIQMLDDFKHDKITIAETEALFSSWQLRQKTHSSFKEKQEQLMKMRQRFDHMQNKCQQEGKKSVLERFRTFMIRNVKSTAQNPVDSKANGVHVRPKGNEYLSDDRQQSIGASYGRRPYSNSSSCGSSRSSSSLSNRSSTLSGLSVSSTTDSGAQSDVGEEPNVLELRVAHQNGSSRHLNKPVLPKKITNRHGKYTANPNPSPPLRYTAMPFPSLPARKHSPTSPAATTFSTSCRGRNPMPVPRVTSPTSSSERKTSSSSVSVPPSPDYITPDADNSVNEGCAPSLLLRASTTNLGNIHTMSPSSIGEGYLCMDTTLINTSSRRRSTSPRPSSGCRSSHDLDYSNVVYGPNNGLYMDMSLQSGNGGSLGNDCDVRAKLARTAVKVEVAPPKLRSHLYINAPLTSLAVDCDFLDRCDSVPDIPPPAPPTSTLNRSRPVQPPPLPPRNPQILTRTK